MNDAVDGDVVMADEDPPAAPNAGTADPAENPQPTYVVVGKRRRKASYKAAARAVAFSVARAAAQAKKEAKGKATTKKKRAKAVRKKANKKNRKQARKDKDADDDEAMTPARGGDVTPPSTDVVMTASPSTNVNVPSVAPTLTAEEQADAKKAVATAAKAAAKAAKRAAREVVNAPRRLAHERTTMKANAPTTNLSTPHPYLPFDRADAQPIKSGDHVRVAPDLSPGHYCHGGVGWVVSTRGKGASTTACVRWSSKAGRDTTRHGPAYGSDDVPLARLTKVSAFASPPVRKCRQAAAAAAAAAEREAVVTPVPALSVARPIQEELLLAKVRNKGDGWRRRQVCGAGGGRLSVEQKLLAGADAKAAQKAGGGHSAAHLRLRKRSTGGGDFELVVKADQTWEGTKPLTKDYLATAWGIGRSSLDDYMDARHCK
jgi:hypothetical protein